MGEAVKYDPETIYYAGDMNEASQDGFLYGFLLGLGLGVFVTGFLCLIVWIRH